MNRRTHNLATLLLTALMACTAGGARADALDGLLEVRSAYMNIDNGVFQLFARMSSLTG